MDINTVWSALISAGGAILICLINNIVQNGSTRKLFEYRMNGVETGIKEIKDQFAPSIQSLEKELAIMKEKIVIIEKDIEDLKKKGDDGR